MKYVAALLLCSINELKLTFIKFSTQDDEIKKQPLFGDYVELNGTTYYISVSITDAYNAFTACNDLGMKLFSIQNADKQQLIASYLDQIGEAGSYWTSGVRYYKDKSVWSGIGQKFVYTNWEPNSPSASANEVDVCVLLYDVRHYRQWKDFPCDMLYRPFICE